MARIKLRMPENFQFSTNITIRVSDINYGGHLGNDRVLAMAHEARIRYLNHYNFTELNIADDVGLIMYDAAIMYRSEGFLGDVISIDITTADFTRYGCAFLYRFTSTKTKEEIARVKTGTVFFNYKERKRAKVPQQFIDKCYRDYKTA